MNELQRAVDDLIGRIIRKETNADGSITVRADSITGHVEVGQTVYCYHDDGSLPLVVTNIEDGWITAELKP
jgi:pyruvate kinase